jgi:hypothetical protein
MNVLVMLEESPDHSPVLAHVNSVPYRSQLDETAREVVTLYGVASVESLALALAAAVECHRTSHDRPDAIRHLGVWADRGAIGDAAWRDRTTGQLMTRDLDIPFVTLVETSHLLLEECGALIRQMVAGLSMPDWPEGARRAIHFAFTPALVTQSGGGIDTMLDLFREADGYSYDMEGD